MDILLNTALAIRKFRINFARKLFHLVRPNELTQDEAIDFMIVEFKNNKKFQLLIESALGELKPGCNFDDGLYHPKPFSQTDKDPVIDRQYNGDSQILPLKKKEVDVIKE